MDAFSKIKDKEKFRLTIIGQLVSADEKDYYNRLCQHIIELSLQDYIEVLPNVPFTQMNEIYSKSDILLLASKRESAGIVILEAMAQGLCVMSTINNGSCCYIKENDCGYLFDTKNNEELTSQLNYIAEHPAIIKEMGEKSIEVVKEKYQFKNYKEALNVVLKESYHYSV